MPGLDLAHAVDGRQLGFDAMRELAITRERRMAKTDATRRFARDLQHGKPAVVAEPCLAKASPRPRHPRLEFADRPLDRLAPNRGRQPRKHLGRVQSARLVVDPSCPAGPIQLHSTDLGQPESPFHEVAAPGGVRRIDHPRVIHTNDSVGPRDCRPGAPVTRRMMPRPVATRFAY